MKIKLIRNSEYAGIFKRIGASLADFLLLQIPVWLLLNQLSKPFSDPAQAAWGEAAVLAVNLLVFAVLPYMFLSFLYTTTALTLWGQTLGMYLFSIRVVDKNEDKLGFWVAFFREVIAKPISLVAAGLGFWYLLFDENNQTWHDLLAGSFVKDDEEGALFGVVGIVALLAAHTYLALELGSKIISVVQSSGLI